MDYEAAPLPVTASQAEAAVMQPAQGLVQQENPQDVQPDIQGVQPAPAETNGVGPEAGASGSEANNQEQQKGRFKPIDLDSLSPKSKQRVVRNRQAATRSKAKKKEEFNTLKLRKDALTLDLGGYEQQAQAASLRIAALQAENQKLIEACKCPKQ